MEYIVETVAQITSSTIMASLVGCAYIRDATHYMTKPRATASSNYDASDKPANPCLSVCGYAELFGFETMSYETVTKDGFILIVDRIQSRNPEVKKKNLGPVLLMHGLFQSGGVYVTSGADSLAFVLANEGYDVWIGNNRCVERKHTSLSTSDAKFWVYLLYHTINAKDWSMDELAGYDFPHLIEFVLHGSGFQQLIYVGHSQGTSQAFLGLHFNPQLSSKIKCFVALAPAMYIGSLLHKKPISYLVGASDAVFLRLFGRREFVSIINIVKKVVPYGAFTNVAYTMFNFLFNWTDKEWNNAHKNGYFQFTPRPTSTKALLHWFQVARNDSVLRPFKIAAVPNLDRVDSGVESFDDEFKKFDLTCIQCPLIIFYGGKDKIVDARRIVKECASTPSVNLILAEGIDDYEHMDVIWGKHAKELVFDKLVSKFKEL